MEKLFWLRMAPLVPRNWSAKIGNGFGGHGILYFAGDRGHILIPGNADGAHGYDMAGVIQLRLGRGVIEFNETAPELVKSPNGNEMSPKDSQ